MYRHFKGPAVKVCSGVGSAYNVRSSLFPITQVTGPFDAELVAGLPKSLSFICHNGAGYDQSE
jgi:glyoxylate reductase